MTSAGRRGAPVLPSMRQLRAVSAAVAVRVAQAAEAEGMATRKLENPIQEIHDLMWRPDYPKIEVVDKIDVPSSRTAEGEPSPGQTESGSTKRRAAAKSESK
ncbi:hypothetical protein [Ornithinimicrobium panacihumi]|uniref:hypothetical protein n=1 Tax=Ornithinimicrobium panacihumi TaxID=2008449 RepID=UPI003F8B87E0